MISRPSFLRPSLTRFGSRYTTNFGLGQSAWENCANGLGSSNRRYRSNWPSCAFEAWCARGAQAERFAMKSAMVRFGRCSTPRASSLTTSLSVRVPSSKTFAREDARDANRQQSSRPRRPLRKGARDSNACVTLRLFGVGATWAVSLTAACLAFVAVVHGPAPSRTSPPRCPRWHSISA